MNDPSSVAPRPWLRRLKWASLVSGVGLLIAGGVAGWLYHEHVTKNPGPHLAREHVLAVVAQESPVYYRDGTTRIGVFFDDEHRAWVGWDDLPLSWTASIVAAEDGAFWSHPGFDLRHIARAMRDNLSAGRLVAGGSTLTQQTAKNLYYRPDRSLKAKLEEALNALRLERHYTKSEILTFYANQFHVTGNGRGLGIAARYFFDSEVEELELVEAAFLAGMVKGPSAYDPFRGDEARRARNVARAHDRTRYVLGRLVEEDAERLAGPRPGPGVEPAVYAARVGQVRALQQEAGALLSEGFELPFERGTFRYESSAVLDEVARRLAEPPFDEVLAQAGIDDPATAGLRVLTTLDPDVQRAATYGLWHHLTEAGTQLEAHGAEDFLLPDSAAPSGGLAADPQPHTFRTAVVLDHPVDSQGRTTLVVELGGERPCLVDREAIVRGAVAVARGQAANPHERVSTEAVNAFAAALPVGSVVRVSVRSVDKGVATCDLELPPRAPRGGRGRRGRPAPGDGGGQRQPELQPRGRAPSDGLHVEARGLPCGAVAGLASRGRPRQPSSGLPVLDHGVLAPGRPRLDRRGLVVVGGRAVREPGVGVAVAPPDGSPGSQHGGPAGRAARACPPGR